MSGKGPGAGFDFQSRLIAVVDAHILARRPLSWVPLATRDIPVAVTAEGGGSGDDLRVELTGGAHVYECQAKRGLSADSRLDEAIDLFARGMPANPAELGILIVDPSSARTVRIALRDGLEARRQGTDPELKGPLGRVMKRLTMVSAEAVADRLFVQTLDVEQDASTGSQNAVLLLERILDDPDQAGAAWAVLVADGLRMCREGGRRDFDALVRRLGQENIHLAKSGQGLTQQLALVEAQLAQRSTREAERHEELVALLSAGRFATPPDASTAEVDRFTVKLDTAKELITDGKASAALELLHAMRDAVAEATATTRIRYHNLVAAGFLFLERAAEGKAELHKVLELAPDDVTALANMAQAESIAGNLDEAVRYADRVLALEPQSEAAWIVLVQGRPGTPVPPEMADRPDVLTAMGFAGIVAQRWEQAIAHLRRALSFGFDEERALYLAQALYGQAFDQPDEARDPEPLAEARALLDRVVESVTGHADSVVLQRALLTRGQIELLRGNEEIADADVAEAAALFPGAPHATHQLAVSYLRREEPDRALFALEQVPQERWNAALHMARARALVELGRKNEVEEELVRATASLPRGARRRSDVIFGLAEVAIDADLLDLAARFLEDPELEPTWLIALERARIFVRRGDDHGAAEQFESVLASAPVRERTHTAGEYAAHLRLLGDVARALTVLESVDAGRVPMLRPIYARVLFDSREFTKSALLVETAEAEGGDLPVWALQLGAQVALVREDVPSAIAYLRQLYERFPHNVENGTRLAQVCLWGHQESSAIQILDELSTSEKVAARQLLQIAGAYIRAGHPEHALPLAYRAMRMEPDAEDIQLAYVQIFMGRDDDENLDVDAIGPDTAITLSTSRGEQLIYFVVSDDPRRAAHEISVDDKLAKMFLGKRVGDEIVLRPGAASETVAKVTEVRSRFVYLFQDILIHFPERHPESTALQSFKISETPTAEDFEFVTRSVRAEADSTARALSGYRRAGSLPLGVLGSLIGGTIRDAYALLANDAAGALVVELPNEIDRSTSAAASGLPTVLTRSALVTIEALDLFRVVEAMCPQLVVPWSLIDELQDERLQIAERADHGHTSLHAEEENVVPRQFSAKYLRESLARFEAMVAWVRERCEIAPRPLDSIGADEDNPRGSRNVLGASSYDALALADTFGAEVFADDLALRLSFHERTGRTGFSSFGLIRAADDSGRSSQAEVDAWTARLIQLRHASVLMTPRVMVAALRESRYQVDGRITPLLDMLRDPAVPAGSIITFCTETLIGIALEPKGLPHVGAIAYALLEAGCSGRDARQMLHVVDQLARRRMLVMPEVMDATIAAANRYMRIGVLGERPLHSP